MMNKQEENHSLIEERRKKYNVHLSMIIVLFLITIVSVGISLYSLIRVQELTYDINFLKDSLKTLTNSREENDVLYPEDLYSDFGDYDHLPLSLLGDELGRKKRDIILTNSDEASTNSDNDLKKLKDLRTTIRQWFKRTLSDADYPVHNERLNPSTDEEEAFRPSVFKFRSKPDDSEPVPENHGRRAHNRGGMEVVDEWGSKSARLKSLAAIHLDGDTSKYVVGQHTNFNGNGHLRHHQRTFMDWKPSNWVQPIGMEQHFSADSGAVKTHNAGLYFVYAQIYYLDEHNVNGFRVYKNEDILLQCTVTAHSQTRYLKGNTCYTASVAYLDSGDRITLRDLADSRYSLFEPGKSFFGLIKLGDVKMK